MTQSGDNLSRRLGRLAGAAISGEAAGAELELADWARQPDCPPAARVMLAALLARRGDVDAAAGALDTRSHDPLEMLTRLCLLTLRGDAPAEVESLVHRLHQEFSHLPLLADWLALAHRPQTAGRPAVADGRVEELAAELLARPRIIRTLVYALRRAPDAERIELLRRAVARIAPEFARDRRLVMICQALAELAELAHDADEARRWAHRGLKIDPYHAELALVLSRIEDDAAVGPPAAQVLDEVARQHPNYLDVRAALIRREHRDGRADEARRRLDDWLTHEPDSPLARALQQELAGAGPATRGDLAA